MTDADRRNTSLRLEPFPRFRARLIRVLAECESATDELELALTDAVARRMLMAANRSRRFPLGDLPPAEESDDLDALIVELRKTLMSRRSGA